MTWTNNPTTQLIAYLMSRLKISNKINDQQEIFMNYIYCTVYVHDNYSYMYYVHILYMYYTCTVFVYSLLFRDS